MDLAGLSMAIQGGSLQGATNVARKNIPKAVARIKSSLSRRLKEIRQEIFGEHGGPELARRLKLPARTWYGYESGVTVPAEILLNFIEQTGANPSYLLTGEGPRYRSHREEQLASELTPLELLRRGLEELERTADRAVVPPSFEGSEAYVAVRVYPLGRIGNSNLDSSDAEGEIMAFRQWIANPSRTIAVRIIDNSMTPVLPAGSFAAIDRSMTDPPRLHGRIVAARSANTPMIRWLDVSERHLILRPNSLGREFPLIPLELNANGPSPILGRVVCVWGDFHEV
jgi:hypothetical protein